MKISLSAQAELELVEGTAYYAREASAEIAGAFISEFERSANLLAEYPQAREYLARAHSATSAASVSLEHRLRSGSSRGPDLGGRAPAPQARLLGGALVNALRLRADESFFRR